VLVVDGTAPDETMVAAAATLAALERIGVARGRVTALVTSDEGDGSCSTRTVRDLARLGLVCVAHDPDRPDTFLAGRLVTGRAVELDDALREAESLIGLAPAARLADGAYAWLFRGVGSRAALASCDAVAAGTLLADHQPIDLLVSWRLEGKRDEAWVGSPGHVEWALRGAISRPSVHEDHDVGAEP